MAKVEKVGVGWDKTCKNGKCAIKISINKEIFILYKNTRASKPKDPDYVICRFVDEPKKENR